MLVVRLDKTYNKKSKKYFYIPTSYLKKLDQHGIRQCFDTYEKAREVFPTQKLELVEVLYNRGEK